MVSPVAVGGLIEGALTGLLKHLVAALGADDPAVRLAFVAVEASDVNVLGFPGKPLPAA